MNPQNCRGRKTAPARSWGGLLLRAGEDGPGAGRASLPDGSGGRKEDPGLPRPVGRRPGGEAADGEAQQIAAAARRKKPSARIKPPNLPEA